MNLKKNGKLFTSKFVGTGPSSYEKRIYRAAVSQKLRNTGVEDLKSTSLISLWRIRTRYTSVELKQLRNWHKRRSDAENKHQTVLWCESLDLYSSVYQTFYSHGH